VIGDGESHKSERHVDMLPNLREWLLSLRKHSGKITAENFRKHFESARGAAGIVPWPDNALRNSFGSYHLKHFGNDALTRPQMAIGAIAQFSLPTIADPSPGETQSDIGILSQSTQRLSFRSLRRRNSLFLSGINPMI